MSALNNSSWAPVSKSVAIEPVFASRFDATEHAKQVESVPHHARSSGNPGCDPVDDYDAPVELLATADDSAMVREHRNFV